MTLSTNATLDKGGSNGRGVHVIGDTTEGAMIVAAEKVGWTRTLLEQEMPRVAELPFSSERKAMTTIHRLDGDDPRVLFPENSYISITKGAPDRLLEWATHEHVPSGPRELSDERRQKWAAEIDSLAAKGLRVLGVAYRPMDQVPDNLTPEVERQLTLLGLVGIVDPARPEAKDAVRVAREAGIRSIMITGDHALTAEAIATNLGIIEPGQKAITGSQLDTFSDSQLVEALRTTSAFARVSPEHKLRIVRVLKAQNEVVAMTGDGVNDAPALKQADIGVAMGITGTDVSKGAADMVLTDDNFASIVAAVEEGRTIYDNIRKFVKYLLSSNVGEIMVMFTALMIGLKIPLLAIQILWINLVTDGLPAIALGFEGGEANVMKRKPRQVNESIFAGRMGRHILWVGALIAVLTLGGFIYGFTSNGMDPFSPTLGLAQKSAAEVIEIVGEDVFNEHTSPVVVGETLGEEAANLTWDELSVEQRVELMESDAEGLEEESEGILGEAEQLPRTLAFSVLAFTQMFHVTGIHGGDRSYFFRTGFRHNRLLLYAILSTFVLQLIVIYTPLMQSVFGTVPLSLGEVVFCVVISSVVLLAVEAEKFLTFGRNDKTAPPSPAG
jgi:Ca2+-transporting ATPase